MERTWSSCGMCIVVMMLLVHYVDLSSSVMTREYCLRHENLTVAPCLSGGIHRNVNNITYFPNFLGHQTSQEAIGGFNDFYPYLQVQCSPNLQQFLCAVYFTWGCDMIGTPIFPCREFCERVRDDCDGAFRRAGTAWPDSLDCNDFWIDSRDDHWCIRDPDEPDSKEDKGNGEDNLPSTIVPPPTPRPDPSEHCQPLPDDPICQSMPYTTVIYPNILGQGNHSDALVELHRYSAFMSDGGPCSDLLRTYLCLAYLPPCKIVEEVAAPIPPCKALCELVLTDSCIGVLAAFEMELPSALSDCSMYPKQSDSYPTCFMPGAKYDPLVYWSPPPVVTSDFTAACKEEGCVDVLHSKCRSFGFWVTSYPNLLGHTNMQEALDELDRLVPFIDSGCSDKLQVFACYAFFVTPSTTNHASVRLPCQSACQEIWKSCRRTAGKLFEKRPRLMTCRLYPTENCDSEMGKRLEPITILNASRVNTTYAFVEFTGRSRLTSYSQVSKWGVRDNFVIDFEGKETQQEYFELYDLLGHHVIFWPWNAYGRGSQPTVAWIPPHDNRSIPDHCERVDIMHCSKLGYTTAGYSRDYFWYWTPPDKLLDSWRDYFTEETVESGVGCLPRLHELLCGLLAPPCSSSREFDATFPCREFCESALKQCNTSAHRDNLSWLLESLPCDVMLSSSEATCSREFDWDPSEAVIQRDDYQYEDESVRVYCLVTEDRPKAPPDFYGPDGNLIPVTSPNAYSSGRQVIQLSPRLTMLFFKKVPIDDVGTYTCKAAGGRVLRTTEIRPLVKCMPSFNHTLCDSLSRSSLVQSPNVLGHTTQYQAEVASYNLLPLLATDCSPDLLELVCALYAPECAEHQGVIIDFPMQQMNLPSQELCNKVKSSCAEAAADIGFEWPSEVQCDKMAPDLTSEGPIKEHIGPRKKDCINLRRYDITDLGIEYLFYGWVDVQGQGAANDYCRVVSIAPFKVLSCALAGTQGENQYNYNSSNPQAWLDLGHTDTWYMRDRDGDGRDDYCRCVGAPRNTTISCLRAGAEGFEDEFEPEGAANDDCQYIKVNKLFGP
ncbi:uncharacterized protein LOC119736301 [Patiria miniata]|uniref:Uncharacterized protein n=1 Tax=Patiria miniata TaxID=46514 RepID=A0A914AS36_PATMI|nr:uncharacterized protein LOC119736301 [Patiria miniata]